MDLRGGTARETIGGTPALEVCATGSLTEAGVTIPAQRRVGRSSTTVDCPLETSTRNAQPANVRA